MASCCELLASIDLLGHTNRCVVTQGVSKPPFHKKGLNTSVCHLHFLPSNFFIDNVISLAAINRPAVNTL